MKKQIKNIALVLAIVLLVTGGVIGTNYIQRQTQETTGEEHLSATAGRHEESQTETEPLQSNETEKTDPKDGSEDKKQKKETKKKQATTDTEKKKKVQSDTETKKTEKPKQTKKTEGTKKTKKKVTISIRCDSILEHMDQCDPAKRKYVPENGWVLKETTVTFTEGETVFDVLKRVCKQKKIPIEYSWTPVYNNYYIEGIHHLYEFDCGYESGWTYRVDGVFPNYGCSEYRLEGGESVVWEYTCENQGTDDESR